MFVDLTFLTILYSKIGYTMNPFALLYLVYVVVGGVILQSVCSYSLLAFAITCNAVFFYIAKPMLADKLKLPSIKLSTLFTQGQPPAVFSTFVHNVEKYLLTYSYLSFFVFSVGTILVGVIVIRIRKAIKIQQQVIHQLEEDRLQNEKLTTLAAFAAGAAHEFSTPLSTIAISSGEMLQHFKKHGGNQSLIDDARLIREQVNRCKEILFQISAGAGEHLGEADMTFNLPELINEIVTLLNLEHMSNIHFINTVGNMSITLPMRIFRRTIRGLFKNAIDASPFSDSKIILTSRQDDTHIYFEVCDQGVGMDQTSLQRATEPFYTTKDPGKGMGLGLYLTKMIAARFDGDLELQSSPGKGTTAILSFAKKKIEPIIVAEPS
jgi:two-component system sensor histidine kinase RegB